MFKKNNKIIVSVSREGVVVSSVNTRTKYVSNEFEEKWNSENSEEISRITKSIIKKLKRDKVRILLNTDSYYLLRLPYQDYLTLGTRKAILAKVSEKVPEDLDEYSWDYKVDITEKNGEKCIIAFAPVKHIYDSLVLPIRESGIKIEAVEPKELAEKRHKNPIVGLAIKKDIKGKDEEILNLKSEMPILNEKKNPEITEKERKQKWIVNIRKYMQSNKKSVILIIVPLVVLIISGSLLKYYLSYNNERNTEENIMIESESSSETIVTSESTQSEVSEDVSKEDAKKETKEKENEEIDHSQKKLENINVLILNGSGISGEADNVYKILTAEGFQIIKTSNAGNFDYKDTEIQYKKDVSETILKTLERALNGKYTVKFVKESLNTNAKNDVILTVGQKIN